MAEESLAKKTVVATRWSLITQIISKLISPITQLILAHLLAPEVFGVIALVTMVTSFADMFSDAGFQKYLIQHEYESDGEYRLSADVAFWTNLVISLILWGAITAVRQPIAGLLGDATIDLAIVAACASLPLTAAVSVQTAVYQRKLDFKTLFYSKVGSSLLILFVSVPLAAVGLGYWSMIIGTLASNLFLAIWLTLRSDWKPSLRYSFSELKAMFSFSAWTLIEALSIWVTSWIGAFILGTMMNEYYLGLYNTSVSLVNAAVGIVSYAVNPVVFSSLSRLQTDRKRFDEAFYKMQKCLAMAIVPIAAALFVFNDMIVGLYLGENWLETATFFGLYSLASAFVVVFGHLASDTYRALGMPRLSLLGQLLFLCFLVPSLIVGAYFGYGIFSYLVPAIRALGSLVVNMTLCKIFLRLSPWRMIKNSIWVYVATLLVGVVAYGLIAWLDLGYLAQCVLLVVAAAIYFALLVIIKDLRITLIEVSVRFGFAGILKKIVPAKMWNEGQ